MRRTVKAGSRVAWRTADEVELATAAWVAWWNAELLHGACGDIPPAEFEARYQSATVA
jgi:putative transposase